MLNRLLAQRLGRYIKGLSGEQVSARLLSGELSLTEVEIDLVAVADLLVGALPYTLELRRVACGAVSVKVPWQALRSKPICVEVRDCEVEVQVHRPTDKAWLASQTSAQHAGLLRNAAAKAAEDPGLRDEDAEAEEDRRQLKDVEAKLRVGLQNVIGDGLRFSLQGLKVTLTSADPVHHQTAAPPGGPEEGPADPASLAEPLLQLSVGAVSTIPCTRAGAPVDRPDDVYEAYATCVRLYRMVEVRKLRVDVVAAPLGDGRHVAGPVTSSLSGGGGPGRRGGSRGWTALVEHADADEGPVRVWVEQKRLAGFIPNHRAQRVCPFSSETVVGLHLSKLRVPGAPERQVAGLLAAVLDACAPPYVPPEALPEELLHLHWRRPGPPPGDAGSGGWCEQPLPDGAWAPPSRPVRGWAMMARAAEPAWPSEAVRSEPSAAGAAAPGADVLTWSAPSIARSSTAPGFDVECREQLVDRRLSRLLTLHVRVRALAAEMRLATELAAAFATVEELTFSRETVFPLDSFERRCLTELGLVAPRPAAAAAPQLPVPSGTPSSQSGQARRSPSSVSAVRRKDSLDSAAGPGAAAAEPPEQPPLLCLNALGLRSVGLWWRLPPRFAAATAGAGDTRLLQLEHPAGAARAVTLRWKELPPPPPTASEGQGGGSSSSGAGTTLGDPGWQPIEGCVHGARLAVNVEALKALGELLRRVLGPALEIFKPPPLDTGWCRVSLHDLELQLPEGLGAGLGSWAATLKVPALLLTSVPDFGQLFCALEAAPSRLAWSLPPALLGAAASREAVVGGQLPAPTAESACACGRQLADGCVHLAAGFVPIRGRGGGGSGGDAEGVVSVSRAEFAALVQARVGSEGLEGALPELRQLHGERAASAAVDPQSPSASPSEPLSSPLGKRASSSRSGLGRRKAASASPTAATADAHTVEALASQWATLQDQVTRLRARRREADLRCGALRRAAAAQVERAEARLAEQERELARGIAEERARQAELSAKAEEQRRTLSQLLRNIPAWCTAGA